MPPKGPKVDHRNTEALDGSPATEAGTPRRSAMGRRGRGASHVVGAREIRAQGEGRQEVGTLPESEERSGDPDQQADKAWVLDVQRKLYQWSRDNPAEAYRELWNWVTDPRNLRCAWRHAASNKGKRSAGTDGMTVARICRTEGEAKFIDRVREELRSGSYRPSPGRRKLIPKPGKPGAFRPLAIPTVADRVVQGAVKQILEPIFEAQFWPVSYGFRPGRGCHGALEHLRITTTPRAKAADGKTRQAPYSWIIEGDIKDCFGQISHHALMERLRRRVADRKVTRLVLQFLKAGVLDEEQFIRTPSGTPQGGVISPLLANIALSAVEERYERWVYRRPTRTAGTDGVGRARRARDYDRRSGRLVCFPIRYADDFVVLVHGSREQAEAEKNALAEHLRMTLGLELSAEKTRTIPITEEFVFLGHRIRLKWDRWRGYYTALEVPKAKAADLRHRIKRLTGRSTLGLPLARMLTQLNRIVRGWGYFYRHCHGAGPVFHQLDWYVDGRVWRWLKKKHGISTTRLLARYKRWSTIGRRKGCGSHTDHPTFLTALRNGASVSSRAWSQRSLNARARS
jgi:RNA-directed DNA polymerase